jgi:hypothetical protein
MILNRSGMPDISFIICTGCLIIKPLPDHNPSTSCTDCGVLAKTSLARVKAVIGAGLCLPTEKALTMTMTATAEDSINFLRDWLNNVLSSLITITLETGKEGIETPCKLMAYINSIGQEEKNLLLPDNNTHKVCLDGECLDLGPEDVVRVKLLDDLPEISISELQITTNPTTPYYNPSPDHLHESEMMEIEAP